MCIFFLWSLLWILCSVLANPEFWEMHTYSVYVCSYLFHLKALKESSWWIYKYVEGTMYMAQSCLEVRRHPQVSVFAYCLVWDGVFLFFASAFVVLTDIQASDGSPVSASHLPEEDRSCRNASLQGWAMKLHTVQESQWSILTLHELWKSKLRSSCLGCKPIALWATPCCPVTVFVVVKFRWHKLIIPMWHYPPSRMLGIFLRPGVPGWRTPSQPGLLTVDIFL